VIWRGNSFYATYPVLLALFIGTVSRVISFLVASEYEWVRSVSGLLEVVCTHQSVAAIPP
jgi:hypothetical protein